MRNPNYRTGSGSHLAVSLTLNRYRVLNGTPGDTENSSQNKADWARRSGLSATSLMVGRPPIAATLVLKLVLCLAGCFGTAVFSAANAQVPDATPPPIPKLKQKAQEIDPDDVISVNTTEVLLPVTVRDHTGQLVSGLSRTNFRIFEDGMEQPLSDLGLRQAPVDVVLLVDASSSVSDNLDDFRRAAEGFAAHLGTDDRISLIQFDDRVLLLQDWTRSMAQLRRALRRVAPGMFTRFNDAMLLAARDQLPRASARHAIIVLTDGIDSGRGTTFDAALRAALQSQTTIYVVSNTDMQRAKKESELSVLLAGSSSAQRFNELRIGDLRLGLEALDASERNLSQLTRSTGGRVYKPASFNDLERIYKEVADELRHQYAIYYSPLNRTRDGAFRRVQVETNPKHQVSARIGYFAPKK